MLQTIDYKQSETSIKVGFKKYHFVVYGEIAVIEGFTKEQYLQVLYEQCKSSIDYETERYNKGLANSIITDLKGEEFIPEKPKLSTISLIVDKNYIQFEKEEESAEINLLVITKDQYDDEIKLEVNITTTLGIINKGILIIPKVEEDTEVFVTVSAGNLEDIQKIHLYNYIEVIPQQPSEIEILRAEKELLARSVYDLTSIVEMILIGGIEE